MHIQKFIGGELFCRGNKEQVTYVSNYFFFLDANVNLTAGGINPDCFYLIQEFSRKGIFAGQIIYCIENAAVGDNTIRCDETIPQRGHPGLYLFQ